MKLVDVSARNMADEQTTRLLMSHVLDRNGLAHNDSVSDRKMPYVHYGGGSLALLLESRCSQLEGSLQAFQQWIVLSNSNPSPT